MKKEPLPSKMKGMLLLGHGGFEQLSWCEDIPLPSLESQEVLIKVGASSLNNTDINTRIGWYSKSVTGDTNSFAQAGYDHATDDGSWTGNALQFPHIQGADCCGKIVAAGSDVPRTRIGERVLVRTMQESKEPSAYSVTTFGSECHGAFAEYTKAHTTDALCVNTSLSDVELATFPCAYSTALGMVERCTMDGQSIEGKEVLITGASGGVGVAAIQIAKAYGARVTAMTSHGKEQKILQIGADKAILRENSTKPQSFPKHRYDVVLDLVGGPMWGNLIEALKPKGRYVASGAIAGPIVSLDLRTLYLSDLTLYGSTYQPSYIFEKLIEMIESEKIKPVLTNTYPLAHLKQAQEQFLTKNFIGKIGICVQ